MFAAVGDADERHRAGAEELVEFGGPALFGSAVGGQHPRPQGGAVGHEPSARHVVAVLLAVLRADRGHIADAHPHQFVAPGQPRGHLIEARGHIGFVGDHDQQQPSPMAVGDVIKLGDDVAGADVATAVGVELFEHALDVVFARRGRTVALPWESP